MWFNPWVNYYEAYVEIDILKEERELEAFLWWRGIDKFPRVAQIKPTGTFFTRKHRANARTGLRYRDRLRGSEVTESATN